MPNEPQREIEKTLTAYARQRREQAGASEPPHPATRRLLMGEALRTWSRRPGTPRFWARLSAGAWLRLAMGSVAIILVALVVVDLLPGRKPASSKSTLALNEFKRSLTAAPSGTPESGVKPADDLATRNAPAEAVKEFPLGKQKLPAPMDLALNQPAGAAGGTSAGNLQRNRAQTSGEETKKLKDSADADLVPSSTFGTEPSDSTTVRAPKFAATAVPMAQPATPPAPSLALAGQGGRGGGGGGGGFGGAATSNSAARQQFARADQIAAARKMSGALDMGRVLSSFRVEQTGGQLRVIDGDGSVYSGSIILPSEKITDSADKIRSASGQSPIAPGMNITDFTNVVISNATTFAAPATALPTLAVLPPSTGYSFRVSGTNLTLGQEVVFSGRFEAALAAASSIATPRLEGSSVAAKAAPVINATQPEGKIRVSGHIIIGGTNQWDISAEAGR